jgi:hypothetical protein
VAKIQRGVAKTQGGVVKIGNLYYIVQQGSLQRSDVAGSSHRAAGEIRRGRRGLDAELAEAGGWVAPDGVQAARRGGVQEGSGGAWWGRVGPGGWIWAVGDVPW